MKISISRLVLMFKRYDLKLSNLVDVFDTTERMVKKILIEKTNVVLEYDEAERLLKYLTPKEVISLMPRMEVMRIASV